MRGKQIRHFGSIAAIALAGALLASVAPAQTVTPSTSDDTENSGPAAPPAPAAQSPANAEAAPRTQAPAKARPLVKRQPRAPSGKKPASEATAQAGRKTAFVDVVVTNRRGTGLVQLDAVASDSGAESVKLSGPLAPGEKAAARLAHDKGCTFDLHGVFEDGATTASTGVDLCAHPKINLVE